MTTNTIGETIYAQATAPGRAAIAIIRLSGPKALKSLDIFGTAPKPDKTSFTARLRHPVSRETIDHAYVLTFESPRSYTGEDIVEYHLHGSAAVTTEILSVLSAQNGYRLAEPGEFTRRAFENGKLDLTEAEAVADLIHAETIEQRRQAVRQLEGGLSQQYLGWTERLKQILAHMEAEIEFPDEDLPPDIQAQFSPQIGKLSAEIALHLDDNQRGERLRDGIQIVIIGAPNVGKSSLINLLAKRDIAIVSDMAGTTRDIIEAHLDLEGFPVIISDTAGLRPDQLGEDAQDKIESEGIKRALQKAREADIKILMFDAAQDTPDAYTQALEDENSLILFNKSDLKNGGEIKDDTLSISVKHGTNIDILLETLATKVKDLFGNREAPSLTKERHRIALNEALEALGRAQDAALPELMAEDVRLAIRHLGSITGRVDVEEMLDVIFRDFCIGK